MLGEQEGWLNSQCFAPRAVEEEKNKLPACGLLGVVHLQTSLAAHAWMGWDGGSGETRARRLGRLLPDLHSHRRDGDVDNWRLALFWGMI